MPINEYGGLAPKERWPTEFDLEGVPRDNNLRQRLVEEKEMALGNKFAGERVVPRDLGAPVHVPYVYREYPKLVYHATKKTEASIVAREKAENHNRLHPVNPQFVPELLPVTRLVHDKEEERKAFGAGFRDKAPNPEGWEAPDPPATPKEEPFSDSFSYQAKMDSEPTPSKEKPAAKKAAKKGR